MHKNNILPFVKSSYLLNLPSSTRVWFTHVNMLNCHESKIPDNGYIFDKLISLYNLKEFDYFLILFERKQTEYWTGVEVPIPFQALIEVELNNISDKTQIKNLKKRG